MGPVLEGGAGVGVALLDNPVEVCEGLDEEDESVQPRFHDVFRAEHPVPGVGHLCDHLSSGPWKHWPFLLSPVTEWLCPPWALLEPPQLSRSQSLFKDPATPEGQFPVVGEGGLSLPWHEGPE